MAEAPSTEPQPTEAHAADVDTDISVSTKQLHANNSNTNNNNNDPITSKTGNQRPPYTHDASKVTLRFIFANKDGLAVTMECMPTQTIGEIKGLLLAVWPEDLPKCTVSDRLRFVCMGKGILMPDSRSLEECQVPVFTTHPTPVNVSVKPDFSADVKPTKAEKASRTPSSNNAAHTAQTIPTNQGCACVIL